MIRPLRSRHRATVAVVGVVTGVLLVGALAVRREVPAVAELRVASRGELSFARPGVTGGFTVFEDRSVAVAVAPSRGCDELAVYWVPGATPVATELPERSFWLGPAACERARTYRLPRREVGAGGQVVLYSLARYEVHDRAALELPAEAVR